MKKARPKLAEVNCTPIKFNAGDRVLVRVYRRLEPPERKKLRRAVERWAGVDVEVLIYDATQMEVHIERGPGLRKDFGSGN